MLGDMTLRWTRSWGPLAVALLAASCGDEVETHPATTTTTGTAGAGGTGAGGGGGTGAIGAGGGDGGSGGVVPCEQIPGTTELVAVPNLGAGSMCIDATEVTRGQYESWLGTSPDLAEQPDYCSNNVAFEPISDWPPAGIGLTMPVTFIDWCDARAYCVGHGKHLCGAVGGGSLPPASFADPSSSEWFNACSEGGQQTYPYGDVYVPYACNGLDSGNGGPQSVGTMADCRGTRPIFDLSGSVWEWEDSCSASTGGGDDCRVRGGGFNATSENLTCAADSVAARDSSNLVTGFRCCADPPS